MVPMCRADWMMEAAIRWVPSPSAGGNILGDALMKARDGQKLHVLAGYDAIIFVVTAMQLEIEDVAPAQF